MEKISSILQKSIIHQKQNNIISDMDGETVMMSIANGKYYNLGTIGGMIWSKLIDPITFEELIDDLTAEFDIDRKVCESHVISFLDSLHEENLIVLK
ncbi:lasso peptide biosynthesis PqqD family chaperone [Fictibacillus barbaricus]|uniref:Ubiquitin C-terminal hydrolase n=1 Tax=Fictibacillus barbaricus TaxID=182136 RepID=A0ABU1U1Z7_9BACL|nr:lasso peptide biosynthesis PqqD family chaperone [Fictibacillus barbaricus]MDR7073381.1 ubiquitin C-terminal hydrolase [Fictibacillus barbaricus]